ncbi:hypothetical protein PYCC9005_005116 [Savitreella phatthalungensis]
MSSNAAPKRKPAEQLITRANFSAVLRKRAAEQFASLRAGDGPIPVGQRAVKQPCAIQPHVLSDRETSATAPGRTLKAKASQTMLRHGIPTKQDEICGDKLAVRSVNIQTSAPTRHIRVRAPTNRVDSVSRSPAVSRTFTPPVERSAKADSIAASAVMSSLLQSRIPVSPSQRRLREQAHTPNQTQAKGVYASATGSPLPGVGFSGVGMRVKPSSSSVLPSKARTQSPAIIRNSKTSARVV